ncbi:hypothetical protein N2152v2_008219 [Parachlorella kessleri]
MGSRGAQLLVNGEIAAVITAMRQNARWSMVPNRYAEDELEEPMLEELKRLRRNIFTWTDWSKVEPLEYLSPFLEVINSPETSGPITAVALGSVNKFLDCELLGLASSGVADAVRLFADSVTLCKFEATYPASDDCVLHKILDVLVACVKSQWGRLLTDDNLINIFRACYRIGHYQTEKGRDVSELLTEASRRAMVELVHVIFSQLESIPDSLAVTPLAGQHHTPRLTVSPLPVADGDVEDENNSAQPQGEQEVPGAATGEASSAPIVTTAADLAGEAAQPQAIGVGAPVAANGSLEAAADQAAPSAVSVMADQAAAGAAAEAGAAAAGPGSPTAPVSPRQHEIFSLLDPVAAPRGSPDVALDSGYGIQAMREILQFIVSLVGSSPLGVHQDLPAYGLDLMNVALLAAGAAFEHHESLLSLLQQDLIKAMFSAAKQPSYALACLAGVCQVTLALYVHLGRRLLLQLEALVGLLLLPLAEGKGVSVMEQQQAALEGILDLCHQPTFIRDVYLNLDCRIERDNLFEQICALLSKTAFPVNGPLSAVHLQSLDGILAILSALATQCNDLSNADALFVRQLSDPKQYVDIWAPLCEGHFLPTGLLIEETNGSQQQGGGGDYSSSSRAAEMARLEKHLKGRLAAAAEHFNRDHKKGFQYLQSIHLLPHVLEPGPVARFLRFCPGLGKSSIGEVLGERDAFYENVRQAFIDTFQFVDMDFDMALRLFMDAFRPPGEGQKIDRIMQVFGKRYHQQMGSDRSGLKSADAAYVLAFSVIMLNTDLHNTQNKKKMSPEDFARINDNTNDGEPMPRELLTHIYQAIAREELKISAECAPDELPTVFWVKLLHDSKLPRGKMLTEIKTDEALERDMFSLIWGPTLAAVSVILDNSNESSVIHRALDALLLAARMAAYHQVDEVVDSIVVSLSKFATVLHPGAPKSVVAFGESEKARLAVETMFTIANRYGDWLRSGWRNVVDCLLRLHKLDLLPPAIIAVDGESIEDARQRMPVPSKANKASTGSLFSRAINSLISIEGSDTALAEQAAQREAAATQRATACVEECRVDEVFADSKFLVGESLVELVKACMWGAGNVVAAARTGENTDSAELCLELLTTLVLRNRDRVGLLWPLLHEFLAACTSPDTAEKANALVERAIMDLFRVCQRLLPYKEDTAEMLLHSLKLVIGLSGGVAWELAERIATELLALLKSSAPYVRTEADWKTVCAIVRLTSQRPNVAGLAYECLAVVVRDSRAITPVSYMPLLETSLQFIVRYKQQSPEMAVRYLDLVEAQAMWLVSQGDKLSEQRGAGGVALGGEPGSLTDEQMLDLWLDTVQVLTKLCTEECQPLRDSGIGVLHRTVQASDSLGLPAEIWVQTTRELLIPVVADLTRLGSSKPRTHNGAEKSVRLAVNMLVKVLLQYVETMMPDKDFYQLWQSALQALQDCMAIRHEGVLESVPENVKNMLLVMATNGVLRPDWKDASGQSLWDLTFSRVHTISSGLNPGLLEMAGVLPQQAQQAPPSQQASPTAAQQQQQQGLLGAPQPDAAGQALPGAAAVAGPADDPVAGPAPAAAVELAAGEAGPQASSAGNAADAAAAAGPPPPIQLPAAAPLAAAVPAEPSAAALEQATAEGGLAAEQVGPEQPLPEQPLPEQPAHGSSREAAGSPQGAPVLIASAAEVAATGLTPEEEEAMLRAGGSAAVVARLLQPVRPPAAPSVSRQGSSDRQQQVPLPAAPAGAAAPPTVEQATVEAQNEARPLPEELAAGASRTSTELVADVSVQDLVALKTAASGDASPTKAPAAVPSHGQQAQQPEEGHEAGAEKEGYGEQEQAQQAGGCKQS